VLLSDVHNKPHLFWISAQAATLLHCPFRPNLPNRQQRFFRVLARLTVGRKVLHKTAAFSLEPGEVSPGETGRYRGSCSLEFRFWIAEASVGLFHLAEQLHPGRLVARGGLYGLGLAARSENQD